MRESKIKRDLIIELSRGATRLFNNPVGIAWSGKIAHRTSTELTLLHPRAIHFGLADGSADLIGWRTITISPDMVGGQVAVFTSVEAKTPTGRVDPKQKQWRDAVHAAGGLAAIVRSVDDGRLLLDNPLWYRR